MHWFGRHALEIARLRTRRLFDCQGNYGRCRWILELTLGCNMPIRLWQEKIILLYIFHIFRPREAPFSPARIL